MNNSYVAGLDDLQASLRGVTLALRKRILRNALAAGGRVVRDAARRNAPVLQASVRRRGKIVRKPGTLRKAISVRTSKRAARQGNVGVFVNVRPAQGAKVRGGRTVRASQRGADNPDDPYFWRWQEFGWTPASGPRKGRAGQVAARDRRRARKRGAAATRAGVRFLSRSAALLPQALNVILRQVQPQIARLNRKRPA